MKNRTLKDYSAIDPKIKIKDVLKEMVNHVVDKEKDEKINRHGCHSGKVS